MTEKLTAAGTAARFFVAPPDAVRVDFTVETAGLAIADLQVSPLDVHRLSDDETFAEAAAEDAERRCRLIEEMVAGSPGDHAHAIGAMKEIPAAMSSGSARATSSTSSWRSRRTSC